MALTRISRISLFFGRFKFTLSYWPASKNVKPDALLRLFGAPEGELTAKAILPEGVVVGALSWGIEQRVEEARRGVQVPGECPAGRLFVQAAVRPEVLQWGHASRLVCHPGIRGTLPSVSVSGGPHWPRMSDSSCWPGPLTPNVSL